MFDYSRKPVKWQVGNFSYKILILIKIYGNYLELWKILNNFASNLKTSYIQQ